jgi:transglutaminase-like putative cysteine protease
MLIRAGHRLALAANAPTPLVAMLSIRPDRVADLRSHLIVNDRGLDMAYCHDGFGNLCNRVTLPTGITQIACDFTIADDGQLNRQAFAAIQHNVDVLPSDVLGYLVGSRYCDTDLLSDIAWGLFGHVPAGWQRVQAIIDFVHQHLTYGYRYARNPHRVRSLSGGRWRLPRFCTPGNRIVPMHEYPGPILQQISGRYRCQTA